MNQHANIRIGHSACPHDCPSTCALDVEVIDGRIGRVHGAKDNSYTDGVICAKVSRYADRVHHPERLLKPLQRVGPKGSGQWREISFEAALDIVAEQFAKVAREYGPEAVWPYYYAGTMGYVIQDRDTGAAADLIDGGLSGGVGEDCRRQPQPDRSLTGGR